MLQARLINQHGAVTQVARSCVIGATAVSAYISQRWAAGCRRVKPLFRHLFAQKNGVNVLALNAPVRGALTTVKAKPQQKGIQQCRQVKSRSFLGFVQAWRPVAAQPGNRLQLAQAQGLLARCCSIQTRLPAPPLAWLQTLSIATPKPATASPFASFAWLTHQPLIAVTNTSHSPRPALRWNAVNCVTTSRRQRTAHV